MDELSKSTYMSPFVSGARTKVIYVTETRVLVEFWPTKDFPGFKKKKVLYHVWGVRYQIYIYMSKLTEINA